MRLTLRTLLAYRDRVLKPTELEDMHARVQQSAMAGNLLKRIESLANRPTILAPPVEGKGLGADANSIAEYLDDALKGEKVPELERICLESDVQLAELAQCHQLLSSALSTTVDVPPALRERIVALGDAAARAQALAANPTGLMSEPTTVPTSLAGAAETAVRHAVPQAEGRARFRTDTPHKRSGVTSPPAGGAAVGDAAAVSTAADSANAPRPLVASQPVEAPMLASGGESIRPTGLDLEGAHLAHEVPEYLRGTSRDGWRGPLAIGALLMVLALLVWQSIGSWEEVRQMFAERPPQTTDNPSGASPPVQGSGRDRTAARVAVANDNSSRATEASLPNAAVAPAIAAADTDAQSASAASAQATNAATAAATTVAGDAQVQSTDSPPLNPATVPSEFVATHVAQWLPSDAQAMQAVIFVKTTGPQPLHRMQAAERLPGGTQIFVPPASRPKLDLVGGPVIAFCGPTQMTVRHPETGVAAVPEIDLRLGKALITANSQGQASGQSAQPQSLVIVTPDSRVVMTLLDASTRVALDLNYAPIAHGPITDRSANPPVLSISVIDGQMRLQVLGAAAPTPELNIIGGRWVSVSSGTVTSPQAAAATPAWIDPASDRPVDVLAVEDLQRQLSANDSIGATLLNMATNRRPETRAMAAETLALLGNWDWIAADKNSLSDPRDRSYWTPLLDLTRQIIAANPEDAQHLRSALEAKDAARGSFQADMWIGFTQAQLESEALKQMVDALDSDVLLDRILAIYQLQRLTGKDLGYQAGEVNRASVQQWNREIASGRLQLLPPSKIDKL